LPDLYFLNCFPSESRKLPDGSKPFLDNMKRVDNNSAAIMQKLMCLKTYSWLLLVVMLTVAINGAHASAHAMQDYRTTISDRSTTTELSASDQCPCCPMEQHDHSDGCDDCVNCACHAPLTVQQFQLAYSPVLLILDKPSPFQFLPEVYIPKFIPPQIRV
jgi:hypothetical protein